MKVRWNPEKGAALLKEVQIMKKIELSQIKKQIELFATFMPDEILRMSLANLDQVQHFVGVLLFADVSGFTPLCEKYNKTGKGGIYRLTATLNAYIGAIVEVIYFYGGDVLKFSGDAFLAMWKADPDVCLYKVIHNVIVCALFIQSTLGRFETEVNVLLKVKLAISCGNMTFSVIGDEYNKHYVLLGPAINDVKAAEHASVSGDVVIAPTAWGHIPEEGYDVTYGEGGNVKVWKCLYKPNEKAIKKDYDDKYIIVQQLCEKHLMHRNMLHARKKLDSNLTDSKLTENFIRALPQRIEMKAAPKKWITSDLKPFIIKTVQEQVDEKQPLEYLTEMREITIQFINIVPTTFQDSKLVVMIDSAYQIVCNIVSRLLGVVNKVSLFDKDAMMLVLFGLKGIKHELESQNALKSAYKIRKAVSKLEGVKSVSVGVTNGLVYCGVVGHPLRREFSVIGGSVNKAARIMCAYQQKVTCDHQTYKNSKLSSCYFQLQSALKLKGIEDAGHIFEYNEDFEETITYDKQVFSLLGRKRELELIDIILRRPPEAEGYRAICFHGTSKTGKSKILRTAFEFYSQQDYSIATMELCGTAQRPYFCVSNLYKQLYDLKTKVKSGGIIKDLPRDLWNLNDILQNTAAIDRKQKILSMFEEMVAKGKFDTSIIFVDDIQYIDTQSYEIIETTLKSTNNLRMISAGQFDEDTWDIKWKMSLCDKIKLHELEPIPKKYTAALICDFLKIKGAPKKLITLVGQSCEGRPGWVQSCVLRLVNDGLIEVKFIHKNDPSKVNYVFPVMEETSNAEDSDEKKDVLAVAELSGKFTGTEDLTMAAISLDLFDSFSPYQQLIIKTAAVLGEIFTRSLMVVMLKYPNEQVFACAIKLLFEEDVFDCGTRYISSGGAFTSKEHACLCFMSEEDIALKNETCSKSLNLPKYAFCKVLHFKNKNLRAVAYELLPANQRKELHLRSTDVLENQTNKCPNCLRDNSAAIIKMSTFKNTMQYCKDPTKPYTIDERPEQDVGCYPTNLKDIIRRNIKVPDKNAEDSYNIDEDGVAIPKRKVWDPSTCFCLEMLTRVYSDLIKHSERAGHLCKRIFFLLQYGYILMMMGEVESAKHPLYEASELCFIDADDPKSIISDQFRVLHVGKIHGCLACACLRTDDVEEAKNHLLICLRQYNVPMLSMKYTLLNKLLNRNFIVKTTNLIISPSIAKNSMMKADFAICLNSLSNIMAAEGNWEMAKLLSMRSVSLLKYCNPNITVLCDIYSSALDYYNYCGDGHICEKLERNVSREIMRLYTGNVTIEMHALCRLLNMVFQTRVMDGRITQAVRTGFRSMHLNSILQAYVMQNTTIPVLASVLLTNKRIQEAVEIMRIIYNIGINCDDSILISYFAFCVELYIETNFVLEKVENCEAFAKDYFFKIDRETFFENELQLVVYLYCYYLRQSHWSQALRWKTKINLENICKKPNYRSISNLMKFTECSLIMYVRNMELKKAFINLEEQKIVTHLNLCESAAKKWKFFLPRFYHYKAYFYNIRLQKMAAKRYLKKAIETAQLQNNVLEECWAKLNENVWDGGFSLREEVQPVIKWQLARNYTPVEWMQIMYALPQYN